jgi:5-methyltetrahydrofolate--homocysteine methyltransferase
MGAVQILEYIKNNILLFDGAMGTMLQQKGLKLGENPEIFGYQNPEKLSDIHFSYLNAGSNVILTNTFGCNELKLTGEYTVEMIIDNAVSVAQKAINRLPKKNAKPRYIALDIGPIGEMLEPMGTLSFDRAYEIFKRQAIGGEKAGADLVVIETMMDLGEVRAAVLAVKENTSLPVFCTMTFDEGGRSFTGCLPESMVVAVEGLGVDAIGVNCSLGPIQLVPIVEKITKLASIPVMVQANAGLPKVVDGSTVYDVTPEEFFDGVKKFVEMGVSIVGGCCGTNPEFIKEISNNLPSLKRVVLDNKYKSRVCSYSQNLEISTPMVVGERINPTGKKLLQESIKKESAEYAINLALEQASSGAQILDINVGLPGIDEKRVMIKFIKEIQSVTDTPLLIDSSDPEVLEAGLRYYNGRAIVNSVNGKAESLDSILPIVKKYGAGVVGLALDENGIPSSAEGRLKIAKKIISRAEEYGIKREDIFIDCLSLTVSAQQEEAVETLKALTEVKKLGAKTILGVSNISFGLPNRKAMNTAFLTLALGAGLDLAIINPNAISMMEAIDSFRVLYNIDKASVDYIDKYSNVNVEMPKVENSTSAEISLDTIVQRGLKDEAEKETLRLLETNNGDYIIDNILIPALDKVGKKFDTGEMFLPQLIQSAEAVKNSLSIIKSISLKKNTETVTKGKIIVATVKGDIHDIGKNIVKIMLENYGYEVIDLGKDVPIEEVVRVASEQNVKLVGLSALMTTTVQSMEDTIKYLRENKIDTKVFVGGAVLTENYAKEIGADFYSKDAKSAVEIAKENL